jgi:uncharacterized membrane protein YkoI
MSTSPGTTAPEPATGALARARRAVRTAEAAVPGGRAYDIESERAGGAPVWEVKVARGTSRADELEVRADGTAVVARRRAGVDDDVRKLAEAEISLDRALAIAGGRAGGAAFDEAEIDRSGGRAVWEAEFDRSGGGEVQVSVDARSGNVLRVTTGD